MVFSPNSENDPKAWQREIFFRIKQKRRKAWIHTDGTCTFEGSSVEKGFHLSQPECVISEEPLEP